MSILEKSFKLAEIFTDHMVLQRHISNPVWGKAEDGKKVSIAFMDKVYETVASNGEWCIKLSPADAGGPYEMKVKCEEDEVVIKDIYIGEVWLAGGQSNMQFTLEEDEAHDEIANSYNEYIRYCDMPRVAYDDETTAIYKPQWVVSGPEHAAGFSAVAYYFAKHLQKELNMHIGIIGCNHGATSASCWMSEEYLGSDSDIKVYLDEYLKIFNAYTIEEHEQRIIDHEKLVEQKNKEVEAYKKEHPEADQIDINNVFGIDWIFPPMTHKSFERPCGLYETMFKKVAPYGIRGFIFYQGETDANRSELYGKLFGKMIENWRDDFNNPELPMIFVQLPLYGHPDNPNRNVKSSEWAVLRDQQLLVSKKYNNVHMAVTLDCGDIRDIHPKNKKPVGDRLALLARNKVYGEDIVASGPMYESMEVKDNKIVLSFEYVGSGLVAKDGALKGFTICGEDQNFVEAEATIVNNKVEVYSDQVENPVAVRYAWKNDADAYLYNGEGLPASPFRTDDFDY